MSAETLRRAAALMRDEWQPKDGPLFCCCEESASWFDRSICPEPCGSMHNICEECGRIQEHCPVQVEAARNGDRIGASWRAVADWLDAEANEIPPGATHSTWGLIKDAPAFKVARAYLGEVTP